MRLATRVHGLLDYLLSLLLIGSPWLFGFADDAAARWAAVGVGGALLLYSLFTDYEPGVRRRLQMAAHLLLDALGGVFLAASPWMLGFDERVWKPHVVLGAVLIVAAAITNTVPGYERRRTAR
jgi:hypothetical protein